MTKHVTSRKKAVVGGTNPFKSKSKGIKGGAHPKKTTAQKRALRKPLTDADGEVRELTARDFRAAKPIGDVLPADLLETISKRGRGQQKAPTKKRINISLSENVIEHFKAGGAGWQSRIDDALSDYVKRQ